VNRLTEGDVNAGQRILPARVSAFIDFAVRYLATFRKSDKREGDD